MSEASYKVHMRLPTEDGHIETLEESVERGLFDKTPRQSPALLRYLLWIEKNHSVLLSELDFGE